MGGVPGNIAPAALVEIVRHCLEKNPRQRFRSAHDVAFALAQSDTSAVVLEHPQPERSGAPRIALVALATILIAIVAGTLWMQIE